MCGSHVFTCIGRPLSEACLSGYNVTTFAYGQTGAGKTYTMFGEEGTDARGLTPRVLEHLFALMAREERTSREDKGNGGGGGGSLGEGEKSDGGETTYRCTSSLLEIYNETITDLLEGYKRSAPATPAAPTPLASSSSFASGGESAVGVGLKLREDATRGVYVEGICEEELRTPAEAMAILAYGTSRRSVGATAM